MAVHVLVKELKKLCTNSRSVNWLLFKDINECLNSEACSLQVCTNINGSYICSCRTGFILSTDMKTCAGYSITLIMHFFTHFATFMAQINTLPDCIQFNDRHSGIY